MSLHGLSAFLGCSLIAFLSASAATTQAPREDWKSLEHASVLAVSFPSSLKDAPVTSQERAQIYRFLRAQLLQGTPTPEERRIILSARVGPLKLTRDGNKHVAVQAPSAYCGATGNCLVWVFYQDHGITRLALRAIGSLLFEKETSSHGVNDLAIYKNGSAVDGDFNGYRWSGAGYKKVDCYQVGFNSDDPASPPEISDCSK